ncbi:MAG: hypothetical protein KDB37_17805 [Ilumatobacter sp.]|nr:hypothetical protein [Ilumatobacter sp.]
MRLVVIALVVLLAACGDDAAGGSAELSVTVVADGFVGPTQIAHDGRGGYVIAELNGGEGDGTGRVLHLETIEAEPTVLVDGLLTPTGVSVDGELLWIMERRTLSVAPLDDPSDRRVVLDDLLFNGRSEGTISAVDGGGILFDTSGRRDGGALADGSGRLFFLASPDDEPVEFAVGFKHAYAHAPIGDDRWLVTEISDGRLDGDVPPDEVVIVERGDDFGYPRCIGDRVPVVETGGTADDCDTGPASLALFAAQSTPTGVAVAPWDDGTALVALWVRGEIVAVPTDLADAPHEPTVVVDTIEHPQHLLVDGDRILVTDHASGRILALRP